MLRVRGVDLVEAEQASQRQRGNLTSMDEYVREHLSHLDAFGGVLGLFRAEYAAALAATHAGLGGGRDRAVSLGAGFATCRREYEEAEERSRRALDQLTGTVQSVGEGRLEREVATWGREPGAAGRVARLTEALGRLKDSGDELGETWGEVRSSWSSVRVEAEELGGTIADLRSYEAFVDGARE